MDLGIRDKVAVVTGSSSGLGRAAAEALAAEGVKLVLFARSAKTLKQTAQEIERKHQVPVIAAAGDMRVHADVDRLAETVTREFGGLDILVLNSGRPPTPMRVILEEDDDERWEAAYRTQLWGPLLVARKLVPMLVQRGSGRVIAITSASVKQPMPRHTLSTVFRVGVTAYLKHLANEVASKGITVNTVCPASFDTPTPRSEFEIAERKKRVPVGRLGRPQELGAVVAFLASEHAAFITGASLHMDGGMVASLY
jgi:3-oxoacyl-[acyl-carrier protein] reductase